MEEGDIRVASFFVQGLLCRAGASGENACPPATGLQKAQSWSGVSVGTILSFLFLFLNKPIAGIPRHARKKITQIVEDLTA